MYLVLIKNHEFYQDFAGAVSVFEDLLKKEEKNKANILSGIGRIHLQVKVHSLHVLLNILQHRTAER